VKLTEVPGQKGFDDAAIVIPAGRFELAIIVSVFDVAGLPLVQVMLEFRVQVTTSPLFGE
jgi:hypothetical protein